MVKKLFILFLAAVPLLGQAANAQANVVRSANVEAELISEVESIQPAGFFWTALRMKMDPDWHTYWKNPGDSGLATSMEWTLPEGFQAGEIRWPYPERIELDPLVSYGYENEILLLVPIKVSSNLKTGTAQTIQLHAQWLACEKICIPGEGTFSLSLPVNAEIPAPNKAWIQSFSQARSALPIAGESVWHFDAEESSRYFRIGMRTNGNQGYPVSKVYFFPYDNSIIDHAASQPLNKLENGYELIIPKSASAPPQTAELQGVLFSKEGWRGPGSEKAAEIMEPVQKANIPAPVLPEPIPSTSFWIAVLFAFLGGMILNLMPCVLPVLSIKILNFMSHANEKGYHSFRQGVLYSAGVLASFWILAGLLLFLRAGGEHIGWGFQLQSPFVVLALAILFFVFGLNLFDVFEIGTSLTRVGNIHIRSQTAASFLSGMLATIVATPCTAPFMGTALGYGFTQSAATSFAVFTALGAGMAFPYLALSAFPSLVRFLPKPGRWMILMKRILGMMLFATCLWLLWVLTIQAGIKVLGGVVVGLGLIGIGAWIYGHWSGTEEPLVDRRKTAIISALLFTIAGTVSAAGSTGFFATVQFPAASERVKNIPWRPFSPAALEQLRNEGKPVFIDFTAAWCLTCQVNERLALSQPKVVNKFKDLGVVALKADWTNRDEEITKALASYGRNSIPLYVYYAPSSQEAVLLPELITAEIVMDSLEGKV